MNAFPISIPPPNIVRWGHVYIYANIANAPSGTHVELRVALAGESAVISVFKEIPARHPDARMPLEVIVDTSIPMRQPGQYELRCLIDGEPAGYTSFFVFDPNLER